MTQPAPNFSHRGTDFGRKYVTARDRVRLLLDDRKWHSWDELRRVGGVRYGARLLELRRLGFEIESEDMAPDGKRYRLVGLCEPQQKRVKVLLTEEEAEDLLDSVVTDSTWDAVESALASFRANRGKL